MWTTVISVCVLIKEEIIRSEIQSLKMRNLPKSTNKQNKRISKHQLRRPFQSLHISSKENKFLLKNGAYINPQKCGLSSHILIAMFIELYHVKQKYGNLKFEPNDL